MEFYKFINEYTIQKFKGGFVVLNNRIYTNPKEEHIRAAGFKNLVQTEAPEYNIETEYLVKKYIDGDVITLTYEIKPFETEVENI